MPVRMKDIAADLGLSIVTISKVLRNHPDISEETRERVLQRVKELRYRPNINARSLVTGYSYLIGLVVPDLLHPFFAEVAKTMARTVRKRGYSLIIASSEEDPEVEESEIEHMLSRQIDGIVVAAITDSESMLARFKEHNQPFVLLDREIKGEGYSFVGVDDVAVGQLATRHLIDIGCKRIAHICGRQNSTGTGRAEGYRRALKSAKMTVPENYIIRRERVDTESKREGKEAMHRLLALRPRPDGVFCYNDPMAMGAMEAVHEAGLRIPKDIAIIGCGNLHYDDALQVPLSSVDQQNALIGEKAGDFILDVIEGVGDGSPKRAVLKPKVIVRASTAGASAAKPAEAPKTIAKKAAARPRKA
jgi:LacI family transcriptional regulator